MNTQIIPLGTGKCSDFGGPDDGGVGPLEGLSLVELNDLADNWFARCFYAPTRGVGLARTLNPNALYCAMRWHFATFDGQPGDVLFGYTREQIRRGIVKVTAANGNYVFVQPVDFGPNPLTQRLIDLSPGALTKLGIKTDDIVTAEFIS